jgi:hypothetical protein
MEDNKSSLPFPAPGIWPVFIAFTLGGGGPYSS